MQFNQIILIGLTIFVFAACSKKNQGSQLNSNEPSVDTLTTRTEIKEERPSPLKMTTGMIDGVKITINYGSPAVKGRQIWGALVPYNEVWRTGANEATNIEFSKDVLIEGQELKAGKYGLFTIPGENEWTIIFNSVWDQWGAYDYDASKDVLRIKVVPKTHEPLAERLDFVIGKNGISLVWEKLEVFFSVKAK
ncbi:MAG: DUF2911 domain-containing protein [Flavobacteriales bacterium]|nr:DUF2911 domain-containing protein [Flavobacteriales bacterium]